MAKIKRNNQQWAKTQAAVSEIQENLLQVSNEKVTGGEELFFIDKSGNPENRKKLGEQLKSHVIMNNKSFIPAVMPKKLAKSTTTVAVEGFDGSIKEKKISKNILHKILEKAKVKKEKNLMPGSALASKQKRVKEKKLHLQRCKGGFDLWDNEHDSVSKDPLEPLNEIRKVDAKVVRTPLSFTEKDSRPTMIPAVALPHPGSSYQPTEKDHKDIIVAAADEELKKIAKKEKVKEALAYPPELDLLEDDDGFFDSSSDEEEGSDQEQEVETEDIQDTGKGKSARRLKKSDINKKMRHKQALLEQKSIQEQKNLIKQINKLKDIQKSIKEKETADEIKRKERQLKKLIRASLAPRRTSKFSFNPVPIAAQLPEEVANSLRELAPEGGLIKERFRNLQARGAIEVRVPVNMKKVEKKRWGKYKEVESHDYKRFK